VCRQPQRDAGRQRDVPFLPALRRREHQPGADDADLPAYVHDPAQEVDVLDRQPEHLALYEPGLR